MHVDAIFNSILRLYLQYMHIKCSICFSIHWNVLCNYIIEYQQQRWAASQPGGFRLLIQHHLLLAGLCDCLPIFVASLSLSLPSRVPRTREATTLVCVCLAATNASKHHAILVCVCLAVAYVNECRAAERQPFGQPRPKIENQAWLSRCFSSYF